MIFGGEIKRMDLTYILVISTSMNRENLSELFTSLATIVTSTSQ
jgi:hypothetical protein